MANFDVSGDIGHFIVTNTVVTTPFLCPEIKLRLITDRCPLWKVGEKELRDIGLPDPYWGFAWAGGQALARYILDNPALVNGKRVLDFGAGCAVELIASMKSGAVLGVAADIDSFAIEAARLNASLNGVAFETTTKDLIGLKLEEFDVVLAGDMFYDPVFSSRVISWLSQLAETGKIVLLGDPNRGNLCGSRLDFQTKYLAPSDVDVDGKYLRETLVYSISA